MGQHLSNENVLLHARFFLSLPIGLIPFHPMGGERRILDVSWKAGLAYSVKILFTTSDGRFAGIVPAKSKHSRSNSYESSSRRRSPDPAYGGSKLRSTFERILRTSIRQWRDVHEYCAPDAIHSRRICLLQDRAPDCLNPGCFNVRRINHRRGAADYRAVSFD